MTSHGSRLAASTFSACRSVASSTCGVSSRGRSAKSASPSRTRPGSRWPSSGRACSIHASHISCSGRNGCPAPGSAQSRRSSPASTTSCSGPSRVDSGLPGTARSSNSADVSPSTTASSRRTAPRPSQTPSPAASSRASSCVQPTFSTTSPSVALTTGATHAHSPARLERRSDGQRPPPGQTGHDVREFGEPVAAVGGVRGEPLRDGEAGRLRDHLSGSVTPTTCSAPARASGASPRG